MRFKKALPNAMIFLSPVEMEIFQKIGNAEQVLDIEEVSFLVNGGEKQRLRNEHCLHTNRFNIQATALFMLP